VHEQHQLGHRKRVLEKFLKTTSDDAFADYELLEFLLHFSIPRRDTKVLAKQLLEQFGSLGAVFSAEVSQLEKVKGIGKNSAALLLLTGRISSRALSQSLLASETIRSHTDVAAFLRMQYGFRSKEYLVGLYLDSAAKLLGHYQLGQGSPNSCSVYTRDIFTKALELDAVSVIVAHNHPAGSPQPSEQDWQVTRQIHQAASALDIALLDHIIITATKTISLRELPRWQEVM